MAKNISERQTKILEFIRKFIDDHGFPPSVRDIQEGLQPRISSTSVVDYNLKALEERGQIRRGKGISRAIELVENGNGHRNNLAVFRIPVAPTPIAAGSPIPVLQDVRASTEDTLDVTQMLLGRHAAHPENLYALRVKGESMIDALINDGDVVIVLAQETAEVGQTVAAWLRNEQEATLKRFYPEPDGRVRLQPANKTMDPIFTEADNLEIKGRVVGVLRHVD
ncbi:MAG TPA: transcriptional repressor LexA [Chloroflexia bacterium]|jgi:repressor LexA|nr:transcriptional repressor LexA [Chloroflexia bacterium]